MEPCMKSLLLDNEHLQLNNIHLLSNKNSKYAITGKH